MSKKSTLLLSLALILFPFIFHIGVRTLFFDSFLVHDANITLLTGIISLIVLCVIFGRLYCGILCPIGSEQRLLNWIGLIIFKKRFEIPKKLDHYLRYLKYLFLLSILFISICRMEILYDSYLPGLQFSKVLPNLEIIFWMIIGVTIVGGILFNNFFCKYLCVQGAINGLAGSFSGLRLKRNKELCIKCCKCTKRCPANLDVHALDTIKSRECLYCHTCILACPKEDVLEFYFFNKKVTYSQLLISSVITYILLVILISSLFAIPEMIFTTATV